MEDQVIPEMVGATEEPVTLIGHPVTAHIAVSAPTGPALATPEAVGGPRPVYLNIENITGSGAPTSYSVYLNVPEGEDPWAHPELFAGILPMLGVSLVVARDGDGAVGFSLCRHVADESELLLLAVSPDHRRRGIGRGLLRQFLDRARADGATRVHLEVRDGNPAIEMYRSAGFAPVGRRRNYYYGNDGRQFDALTFSLDL